MRSLFEETGARLQFAGHETFPLRYGWLKKAFDAVERSKPGETKQIFNNERAISDFGVGKNMVLSIRHWALASGMLSWDDEGLGEIRPTQIGRLILEQDPYLEHPGSLWLIHWNLASTPGRAATWYYAFNEFNEPFFSRDLLRQRLMRRCDELREAKRLNETRITEMTLKRDVDCFIRTYAVRTAGGSRVAFEDGGLESPLTELSLVQIHDASGSFQLRRGPKTTLPDQVFAYALVAFWREFYPTRRELSLEAIAHEPGSPGRVFLLDEDATSERLARLDEITAGKLRWDESTGLRQVYAHDLRGLDEKRLIATLYLSMDLGAAA
ncbi:Protein of unknown function [Methylobacterium sp. 190mf]|uniref:DUF4007 family protein n=1 Tax=Methylobacterium sp. 190mf TaxID=1761798 RepID=UPI00089E7D01|nr:DUF4007 family protein [Methylobacterium sp. 190mf]SEG70918.1 Protein of unknown function [Methylobacterium sp. 190mf]